MKIFLTAALFFTWAAGQAIAADAIDCIRNTPSKMTCSVVPDTRGTFRLAMRAALQAKPDAPGAGTLRIALGHMKKPCAEEKDIPIHGEAIIEAMCTWHMLKGSYTVTATATATGAEAKAINLTIERIRGR